MIGVIDYGASNLASVGNALDHLGVAWTLCAEPASLDACDRLILPGVGHFGAAMSRLHERGLVDALCERLGPRKDSRSSGLGPRRDSRSSGDSRSSRPALPLLGLCLGAQLLLNGSEEAPGARGLGLIGGQVVRLKSRRVPHMGWNRVRSLRTDGLLDPGESPFFYFAHSFVCRPDDPAHVAAVTECEGDELCVAVQRGRVFGVQFHPEKSADAGLALLRRFAAC